MTAPVSVAEPPEVGAKLGRFTMTGVVGSGGQGIVIAARDPELDREVAIKIVPRRDRARIVAEAQAMARVAHPNTITVYEVGNAGDEVFIAMELVDGVSLRAWLDAAHGWREIVAMFVRAGRGLCEIHAAGLVHRDFKPENVIVRRDGRPQVGDFGLATSGLAPSTADVTTAALGASLTVGGMVVGTPAVMAPEQWRGEVADARTDQFAFAVSLWTALSRAHPFAGADASDVRAAVLADRRQPRSRAIPAGIAAVLERALAHEPADRWPSLDALLAALERALAARRRRLIIAGAIVAVAAVAGITVIASRAGGDAASCDTAGDTFASTWNPARAVAVRTRFAALDPRGPAIADRVVTALDRYGEAWAAARRRGCADQRDGAISTDLLDRRTHCLDRERVEIDTFVEAWLAADHDRVTRANTVVDAFPPITDCDDPADGVPRPADPNARADIVRAEATIARAWALGELDQFEQALPLTTEALAIADRIDWPPLVARAAIQHARSLGRVKRPGSAALYDRAAVAAALGHDDQLLAEALIALFFEVAETDGAPDRALATRRNVELAVVRAGNAPRLRAQWLHHLAVAFLRLGRNDEALAAEREAIALLRPHVAPDNSSLIDSLDTLASVELDLGHIDEAAVLYQQILDYDIAAHGPNHHRVAESLVNLGNVEERRGNLTGALAQFERSAAIDVAVGARDFVPLISAGAARHKLGRWTTARAPLADALRAARSENGPDSLQLSFTEIELGALLTDVGELDRAHELIAHGVAIARTSKSPGLPEAIAELAFVELARGDVAAARRAGSELATAAGDRDAPRVGLALGELARAEHDCAHARPELESALALARKYGAAVYAGRAVVGIAECQLADGHAGDARAALAAAVEQLVHAGAEPGALAAPRFALARAVVASGGDRAEARTLATAAEAGFATLGEPGRARAREVARWLAVTR